MNLTNLKTGDVLNCTGKRFLSKAIMAATKSEFSHTALFIEIWGQPYIIDAQKDGVNLRPWNAWMDEYNYEIKVLRAPFTIQEKTLAERALTKVGHTGYDFEGLFLRQPTKLLTGKWKEQGDTSERMYCSEYVAWVYCVEKAYRMSPQDFYEWCILNNFKEVTL